MKSAQENWNIRGVPYEVRNAAKLAAKKQRKTLGEWMSDVVYNSAVEEIKGNQQGENLPATQMMDILAKLTETMQQQTALLQQQGEHLKSVEQKKSRRWGF